MKLLIWKEWRETRWIAIGFLLICLLTSLCCKVMLPGDPVYRQVAMWMWSLLALFLGARAFAGEKQTNTMEFLAAQPLRKMHLWALKGVWGFGVVAIVAAINSVLDYTLMLADPFYRAVHLLWLPLSWIVLILLAVYAVALVSSTICDKTVVALGFAVVIWAIVACIIALIARFNLNLFLFATESWGVPLALFWFSLVVLAGSFLIVTWREIWPNYPVAVKRGAAGVGVGTVIVLLIMSSANIPLDRVTGISSLGRYRDPGASVIFSVSVDGKELPGWRIDLDGQNLLKSGNPPFREREHPAVSRKNIVSQTHSLYIANIVSGECAGGCLVEKIERPQFYSRLAVPRRVRTEICSESGTVSWIGGRDRLFFDETRPDGKRVLWTVERRTFKKTCHEELGNLIAVSPDAESFIFAKPDEPAPEGKVRLELVTWKDRTFYLHHADVDPGIVPSLSFVTEDLVQYRRGEKLHLTYPELLGKQYFEHPTWKWSKWRVPLQDEVPGSIVVRGPHYLRRVAVNLAGRPLRHFFGLRKAESIIAMLTPEAPREVPKKYVEALIADARHLLLLEGIATGWGMDLPEELFDEAIFLVPRNRQIVYVKKRDEERSSLWLLDVKSGESTKILDDIDVTSPAVPKALIAPVMDNYFVFVRDARTIWTYRDGALKQIFPPQR